MGVEIQINRNRQLAFIAGERLLLEPQGFLLLQTLAEHAGHVVDAKQLTAKVWLGRRISKGVLAQAVLKVRQALGSHESLIKTVRGQGYLLAAHVEFVTAVATDSLSVSLPGDSQFLARWPRDSPLALPRSGEPSTSLELPAQLQGTSLAMPEKRSAPLAVKPVRAFLKIPQWMAAILLVSLVTGCVVAWQLWPKVSEPQIDLRTAQESLTMARTLLATESAAGLVDAEKLLLRASRNRVSFGDSQAALARTTVMRYYFGQLGYTEAAEAASRYADAALLEAPHSAEAMFARARVDAMQGLPDATLQHLKHAAQSAPTNVEIGLSWAEEALVAARLADADHALAQGLALNAAEPRWRVVQTQLDSWRQPPTAELAVADLSDAGSPSLRSLWTLASLALQKQQPERAKPLLDQAFKRAPLDQYGAALSMVWASQSRARLHSSAEVAENQFAQLVHANHERDGVALLLAWEYASPAQRAALILAARAVPETAIEGLWLKAELAAYRGELPTALKVARAAMIRDVQRGCLLKPWRADFGLNRLRHVAQWLAITPDAHAAELLEQSTAHARLRLVRGGFHPDWLRLLDL